MTYTVSFLQCSYLSWDMKKDKDTADEADILRVFDLSASYGPCVGVTRLQRWERAKKWGLNPPEEVSDLALYMLLFGEIRELCFVLACIRDEADLTDQGDPDD